MRHALRATTLVLSVSLVLGCGAHQSLVAPPTAKLAERAPAAGLAEPAFATSEREAMAIAVHPKTGAEESAAFGVDLHARSIMSMEMQLTYRDTLGKARLRVRRHDVRMSFSDGTERFALDPGKIYERTRVNVTGAAFAFGLVGAMVASSGDKGRRGQFMDLAIQEKTLDAQHREEAGLLFFDLAGLNAARPTRCTVEFEDLTTGAMDVAAIALE
jgi:hypothetical protein